MRIPLIALAMAWYIVFPDLVIAQGRAVIYGVVKNNKGRKVEFANIIRTDLQKGVTSNSKGNFKMATSPGKDIPFKCTFVGMVQVSFFLDLENGDSVFKEIVLNPETKQLEQVEVVGDLQEDVRNRVSITAINPKIAETFPSADQDITRVLATLPGVSQSSELSAQYRVRGGNYDENLIYINDMLIYKPFLVRSGEQEGMNFVNPEMASSVKFYAGGWEPRYGDKLSSVMAVEYKEPKKFGGSISAGLLGGSVTIEGSSKNKRLSHVTGIRHRRMEFLLNTLPTKGEYFPRYTDIQSYISYQLSKDDSLYPGGRTKIGWFNGYARNRFQVLPQSRETSFGTLSNVLRLFVAFEGTEEMSYDTYQTGVNLSHYFSKKFKSVFTQSLVLTRERENVDLEAGYRLCDVSASQGSNNFNECVSERGVGTLYNYARNTLDAWFYTGVLRNFWYLKPGQTVEFGFRYTYEDINDKLNEYKFIDSSDFVTITDRIKSNNDLGNFRFEAYAQHGIDFAKNHSIVYGVRTNYWSYSQELLVSPRIQYAWTPDWKRDMVFRVAAGAYNQPPFYREMRDFNGNINPNIKAQKSYQFIGGSDLKFKAWGRPFHLTSEAYVKIMRDVIPYDIDNIRIRYYGENSARAYHAGMDFRVGGEFIKGAESWFSLGLLTARENVENDGRDWIRRPSDQRLKVGIYFQDHLPGNASVRMYLNLVYSTGLPFGPPGELAVRQAFKGPDYKRVDIGFSKVIIVRPNDVGKAGIKSIWLGAEILNLIAANNTISFLWIQDVSGNYYAIPNDLSQRFLNIRAIVKF
jgi:CarboxypepD_reg-like domain/TonB-dependent Receptor Plug Domain